MLQNWDELVLRGIRDLFRVPMLDDIWAGISFLGNSGWIWIVLAAGLLLFRQTRIRGLYISAGLLLDLAVVNGILKNLIARTRPYDAMADWLPLITKPHDYSFPSGHTAASFVAAVLCWKLLPKRYALPIMVLAVLIAFSRLYLGVHYPSDVIGGALIGYGLAMVTLWLGKRIEQKLTGAKGQTS